MDKATALDPPATLNPHCMDEWFEACSSQDSRSDRRSVLHTYMQLCDSAGLLPFVDHVGNRDVAIRNYLAKRRWMFVRFLDVTKILVSIPILKVKRTVHLHPKGFSVNVEAWVKVEDPRFFKKYRTPWRFSLGWDKEHRYVLELDPGLHVYVRNPGIRMAGFWYFGYTVNCPINPDLTEGSLKDKEAYILHQLWEPLSAYLRGRGLKRTKPV